MRRFSFCTVIALWLASSFGQTTPLSLNVRGGHLKISLQSKHLNVTQDQLIDCIQRAAKAVAAYYGKFPVKEVVLSVEEESKPEGLFGREFGGRLIKYYVGSKVSFQSLKNDWMLTHEMFHLGFPNFDDAYEWADEGLATYLEPIARARVGNLPVESVWAQLMRGLPNGLPLKGDKGLNLTHTWGRTYWGGALYWFLADLEIREKTKNVKSLDTAIRAILAKGGDGSEDWEITEMIQVGDKAFGFPILKGLFDRLAVAPGTEDLDKLWKQLGVSLQGDQILFDDKAPLADIRRAITAK